MRYRVLRLAFIVAAIIGMVAPGLVSGGQASPAQPLELETLLVPPNERFGLNRASYGADATDGYRHELAGEAGAAWNRWPLYWHAVEGPNGVDYGNYDRAVIGDVLRGTNVDVVILGTPQMYASVTENFQGSTPTNLDLPVFADGSDNPGPGKAINPQNHWARFVSQTVERYKPDGELSRQGLLPAGVGVRHWEIWNEPDVSFYWSGRGPGTEVIDYLRLLKVAWLSARAADPQASIVVGGLGYWGREGWIEDLFRALKADPTSAANGDYFDVMAWHVYSRAVDLYNRASWSRHLLRDFGFANKGVWINEANIPVWGDATPKTRDPGTHRGTVEEQAAFILQSYAYAFAGGADKVFTFMLYDDCWQYGEHYGLVRNPPGDYPIEDCAADGKPRPAYLAYKIAASYLRDIISSKIESLGPEGAVDVITFDTKSGVRVSVIANKFGAPVSIDLPVRGRAILIDQGGDVRNVWTGKQQTFSLYVPAASANDAEVGESPYYIVGGRTQLLVELPPSRGVIGLLNGGFEMQPLFAGWWTHGLTPSLVNLPRSGGVGAALRIAPPGEPASRLEQTVRLPGGGEPQLVFSYATANTQPIEGLADERSTFVVSARVGEGQERVLLRETKAATWREARLDLSPYAGGLVTLTFAVEGSRYPMAAYLDDLSLWSYRIILPRVSR